MLAADKNALNSVLDGIAEKMEAVKALQTEIKDDVAAAAEKFEKQKKNIRAAARQKTMTEIERENARQIADELDDMLVALGLFSDTPLGEAAVAEATQAQKANKQKSGGKTQAKKASPCSAQADVEDWDANAPAH